MKVTLNKIDSVNATLTVEIVKDDYVQKVKQGLKELGRKIDIPGFRKGMAPSSLLEKKYGKTVLVEEVEKLLTEQLNTYIEENKLNILGEPLPHSEEQENRDFDNQENYEFTFDLGFAPEINVQLTKDDVLPYYTITISDEMIENQIKRFKASYGTYEQVDQVEGNDMVKGLLAELDEEGRPLEDGISNEYAVLIPSYIKEEEEKNKFLIAKPHDTVIFNPFKAYEGNEIELASFLKIKKGEVNNHTGNFSFFINEITRYKEAEINQELFDKIYEPGTVTSENQFRDKIKELFAKQLTSESDYKFLIDTQKLLEEKIKDVQFPDEFLKRWLLVSDAKQSPESIEENYPKIISNLKYQLIKNKIINDNNINITNEDIRSQAKATARIQFAQYGMTNAPEHLVDNYVDEILKKKEMRQSLFDKAADSKLIDLLKEIVTLDPKEISLEEFQNNIDK
ncbi:MAG: trigger factor [Dysgonamonadaceae bacterium]|jgi:trigger factor|nr:trigger factor [Dysgonamonadaceae bacterium]